MLRLLTIAALLLFHQPEVAKAQNIHQRTCQLTYTEIPARVLGRQSSKLSLIGQSQIIWDEIEFDFEMMEAGQIVVASGPVGPGFPAHLMIDFSTGEYWIAYVGRVCVDGDCDNMITGAGREEGSCGGPFEF